MHSEFDNKTCNTQIDYAPVCQSISAPVPLLGDRGCLAKLPVRRSAISPGVTFFTLGHIMHINDTKFNGLSRCRLTDLTK